jgi:predicted aspartyl protease
MPSRASRATPVAAALLLAACAGAVAPERVEAPADSAAGEVAFELAGPGGGALVVPVHVNGGGPFRFVLDTGATLTCVGSALADSLALPEQRGTVGVGAGIGGTGRMRLVRLDSLRVGGAMASGMTACSLDLEHIAEIGFDVQGLLGLNFLREFRVTLDFDRRVMTLSRDE